MLRLIRLVTVLVALVATAWAIRLFSGGSLFALVDGHLFRSTDPWRPTEWAVGAVLLFVMTGGPADLVRGHRRVGSFLGRLRGVVARAAIAQGGALVIAAALVAIGVSYMTTVASGADGSGYVSQADRWIHGTLKPAQPWVGEVPWPNPRWTFTPLGYKPIDDAPPYAQAPIYSPGLSLLMAGAKVVGGQAALFLVVPFCAGVLVLATFGVARRLRDSTCGLIAAWLVATSPIVLWMLMLPMSDVPVAAAWTLSFLFLLEESRGAASAAGFLAGLAIAIRPNLFFLAPIMTLWFVLRPGPWATTWRRRLRDLGLYGAGAVPAVVFIGALYTYLFGSPFVSGYGRFSDLLDRGNIWPNLLRYVHWAMGAQGLFTVLGLAGVFVPWFWPTGRSRRAVIIMALILVAVTAEYAAYIVFDDWTFLRFFLPVWPILAIGAASVTTVVVARSPRLLKVGLAAAVVATGVMGVETASHRSAFDLWHGNRRYTAAAELVSAITPPNSVVFAMEHSGSLRYYAGRVPIRYDEMPPEWLDRSIDWLTRSGVHCYAVLDDWELEPFRERFEGSETAQVLDDPIFVYQAYRQGATVYVFDLSNPPPSGARPEIVTETDPGRWRDWPAGPEPTLVFQHLRVSR